MAGGRVGCVVERHPEHGHAHGRRRCEQRRRATTCACGSVDLSGNTLNDTGADDTDGNPVFETVKVADTVNNGEKGWVSGGTVSPTAIPANTLVWTDAMIQTLFTGKLSADWLTAGSLKVGGGGGKVAAITVVDSRGNIIGQWDGNGIQLLDPPRRPPDSTRATRTTR